MIKITPSMSIDENEIKEHFIRAPGPGGQKVNKTESAVQLRFDARNSSTLPNAVFLRLNPLAGRRMTRDGVVVITANRFHTQGKNRHESYQPENSQPSGPTKGSGLAINELTMQVEHLLEGVVRLGKIS